MTSCIISCFLLSGCNGQKQIDSNKVETIKVEEKVHLTEDTTSPACQLTLDYAYLIEADTTDSVARLINETTLTAVLGQEYQGMTPQKAIATFKQRYIENYRKEVAELYKEDMKRGMESENLPSWYNYEYSITSHFQPGKQGVTNCIATTFVYSGGAHPNEWAQWFNFDTSTGALITLDKVFLSGAETALSSLLVDELIKQMAKNLAEESIHSIEDLQKQGILNDTKMYVPTNFLLEADKVSFLYNKYDIAPYSVGMIILSLPYEAITQYMLH